MIKNKNYDIRTSRPSKKIRDLKHENVPPNNPMYFKEKKNCNKIVNVAGIATAAKASPVQ